MALPTIYTKQLLDSVPPWLTRIVGEKFMRSLGEAIDSLVTRVAQAVRHRFPNNIDSSSLARIGRERRIRRGPGESAETYATRLRIWWDMHRIRGGPYALLWNLHHFFYSWLPGRKDVVYHSGTRRWIDEDGVITRDAITWEADGSEEWAQFWVFFYVPDTIALPGDTLATLADDILTTLDGDPLALTASIVPSDITPAEENIFTAIPREWSAAHVKRIFVVLLWDEHRLWSYPQPVPQWGDITTTWGDQGAKVITVSEVA
ncbi:MAG: hypothetical protein J0L92_01020 [Deltaproteobacteria bacterium]|nr:hypothetical protein [Deltaproteobacteria bacterium]